MNENVLPPDAVPPEGAAPGESHPEGTAPPAPERARTVLVAGGTGFIGRHMVAALRREGFPVKVLVHRTTAAEAGLPPDVQVVQGDIASRSSIAGVAQGVSHVIHLAGLRPEAPADVEQITGAIEEGTRNLLLEAEAAAVRRFVYLTCLGADEKSKSAFHRLAASAEMLVRSSRCEHYLFRASAVFGPNDGFLSPLFRQVRSASPVLCLAGYGDTPYQPIHVEDLCECLLVPLLDNDMPPTVRPMELGGDEVFTLLQLLDAGLRAARRFKVKLHCPFFAMQLAAPVLEKISRNPALRRDRVIDLLMDHTCRGTNEARRLTGRRLRRLGDFLKAEFAPAPA